MRKTTIKLDSARALRETRHSFAGCKYSLHPAPALRRAHSQGQITITPQKTISAIVEAYDIIGSSIVALSVVNYELPPVNVEEYWVINPLHVSAGIRMFFKEVFQPMSAHRWKLSSRRSTSGT